MDERQLEILLDTMGDVVQDNSVMITALVKLLIEKNVITSEDFEKLKEVENKEIDDIVENLMNKLEDNSSESKTSFGLMGKGGDA